MTSATGPVCVRRGRWSSAYVHDRRTEVLSVGAGSPLLFLHGWGLSPRTYEPTLRQLSAGGYQVIAPSLPGFGHSDTLPLSHQNVHGVAAQIVDLIEALNLPVPIPIVGHSFGGGVALKVAATQPRLVSSLVLACPVGGAGSQPVPLPRMVASVLDDARHRWIARATRDLAVAAVRNPATVVATALAARSSDQIDDLAAISASRIPTRFIFADRDDVITPGAIPTSVFEHVTCEVIAGGHSWLLTDPAQFAEKALAHLAGDAGKRPHRPKS